MVNEMIFTFKGKNIIPTKQALNELSNINLNLSEIPKILENGFSIRKRKKNIIEKGIIKKTEIINVVIVDMGNYFKLIHVGKFTLTKKFKKNGS